MLPAYDEEQSLPVLMPKIKNLIETTDEEYKILVCDDGSSDRTLEYLNEYQKELPLEVLVHKLNRGLGETSRDLFEKAASITKADDIIIRLDCDDTHEPEFIPKMIENIAVDCKCENSQVNIKATTTEMMGFIGRSEGIAAQCSCLIESF